MEEYNVWYDQEEQVLSPEDPLNLRGLGESELTVCQVMDGADHIGHLTLK
jgi:hypothetical protein